MSERRRYVLCLRPGRYRASLESRKVYRAIPDRVGKRRGLVRVVDETGEDYLYPEAMFIDIELPREAQRAFSKRTA